MKKLLAIFLGAFLIFGTPAIADEGMWLLPLIQQLNIKQMKKEGFKLSAEDIYSINKTSLKDAVIIFGRGCSGEIISDKGLILTNHHCGYEAIQEHSTVNNDYLKDGFWAQTMAEEIPTPGLTATFLVRIEDVTKQILDSVKIAKTEGERDMIAYRAGKALADKATQGTLYNAQVKNFFGGNNYYMLVYETYKDIRMVGAPPSSIGKFGGETDNWMWPRHTGDFSLFRVYADKNGNPAEYSKDNVPLKPKYHFPISIKGVKKNDFAMIMGYPGSTERYMTTYELNETMNLVNPNRIYDRGIRQDILSEAMQANDTIRIMYASKFAMSSNYWKNSIGMNKGLKRLHVYDTKKAEEEKFMAWVNQSPDRVKEYGDALNLIKSAVEGRKEMLNAQQNLYECFLMGTEILSPARISTAYLGRYTMAKTDEEKATIQKEWKKALEDFYKDFSTPLDKKVALSLVKVYKSRVGASYLPTFYATIDSLYGGNTDSYIDNLYATSIFASKAKALAFVDNPSKEVLDNDPAAKMGNSIIATLRATSKSMAPFKDDFEKGHRLYIAGILAMEPQKAHYPDANFTMRMTYGQVRDYYPRDAVHYDYKTTLKGVMEKEDPENPEFVVPAKLKELYNTKDYGPYGDKGVMPVNFITNNDITGGNSGSPVINGKGQLIGTAFDGNWEAMSGDIAFEPELQRTICLDVRYTLFIIDKFAGAKRLIDEMTIVK